MIFTVVSFITECRTTWMDTCTVLMLVCTTRVGNYSAWPFDVIIRTYIYDQYICTITMYTLVLYHCSSFLGGILDLINNVHSLFTHRCEQVHVQCIGHSDYCHGFNVCRIMHLCMYLHHTCMQVNIIYRVHALIPR